MSMDLIDIGNGMMMISGPTYMNRYCNMMMNNNNVASGCGGGVGVGQSLDDARSKQQQQPFESFTKSPGGSGLRGMAQASSSIGVFFPFTNAQWKELERQAMVFKYMMHSIPVPYDLLFPFISSPSTDPSGMMIRRDTNLLKLMKNGDPEPGRCRRTDGKKWRCANAVAIDQKYCEKHVHRGRPRSRKHVEAPPPPAAASNLIHKKPRLCPQVSIPKLTSCSQTVASSNHGAFQLHLRNEDLSDGQWQPLMQFPKQDETQHDLVSLGLSMGHVSYNNEDLSDDKTNQEETHDWLSRLGGPLGEVLRPPLTPSPTTTNAASSSTSCNVLHEANGSVSDGA